MGKSTAQLNVAQELFLGAEAALISRFFTTPVSNVTTRLQTSAGQAKIVLHARKKKVKLVTT
ncbi:hypothetical protein RO3G_07480 [Rhizopus delemar RA 99-880]|uniref:Uncharacterized protein n=1 Tax=Rhizopus delemar (strain RA 99-880 / ATCC MYA-4621 / FGSC 9543 / NRRL 43880) TaxID=246409 RepID=I1C2U5_RHIO9|nr:hypothetical protein RO3G_07480 [Rhizopus delemar RA 99-880]|eukprot:EIE82775.1 hypothetical protein RO3G_07480 [Rhizopus delemar RA 99-880]